MKGVVAISIVGIFLTGCGGSNNSNSDSEDVNGYIENPYSEGTGHYAGYEWAERTGGACEGNSISFNDGCEEYYRQLGL